MTKRHLIRAIIPKWSQTLVITKVHMPSLIITFSEFFRIINITSLDNEKVPTLGGKFSKNLDISILKAVYITCTGQNT